MQYSTLAAEHLTDWFLCFQRGRLDFLEWKVTLDSREKRQDMIKMLISNCFALYSSYLPMYLISKPPKWANIKVRPSDLLLHSRTEQWWKFPSSGLMQWMNMYKSNNNASAVCVMAIGLCRQLLWADGHNSAQQQVPRHSTIVKCDDHHKQSHYLLAEIRLVPGQPVLG